MAKKINSRAKGAQGERELAGELNTIFGTSARRGQQYSGIGGADVVGLPGVHIESKRVQALNLDKAMEQAITDAKPDEIPTVMHRKNRKPWLVTVRLDDLVLFAQRIAELRPNKEERDPVLLSEWTGSFAPQVTELLAYPYLNQLTDPADSGMEVV